MIYVDTGAFLGWYVERDQRHREARAVWQGLEETSRRVYTSNFVLDETLTLLARRASYAFSASCAHALYASKTLTILRPDASDELAALEFFEKYADQQVSFTDCVSFALMRKTGIEQAFTFDGHFRRAGFDVVPDGYQP